MNSRAIAAKIIHQVCYQGVSLSDALEKNLPGTNTKDIGFIKALCFGTIRWWIQLQAILNNFLEKPLRNKDKDIECLLCVGLYQNYFLETPSFAVVNETVVATKALKKTWASGLANKILRQAVSQRDARPTFKTSSEKHAHPAWLIEKIKSDWPDDFEKILITNNQKAPLFLRINTQQTTIENYKELLRKNNTDFETVDQLPCALKIKNPLPVEKLPGFSKGFFSVQDASGQKVIEYLDLQPCQTILDACAAPGSKTTHILEACPGIKKLIVIDINEKRLHKIKKNVSRLNLSTDHLTLIASDICDTKGWWDGECFDRILVDAPCSASGVIRRHPDIKILRKKTDIPKLADQQLKILETLWHCLKPRGKLIYTTCSIFFDENETVIEKFLFENKDASVISINNTWGLKQKHGLQILSGDKNRDGFYYCVLEKTALKREHKG